MKELFEVFKMDDLSIQTRIRVIKKLGNALDFQYASNWTREIVAELIKILESKNEKAD